MKKPISKILFAIAISFSMLLSACAQSTTEQTTQDSSTSAANSDSEKMQIVATTFPIYDWLREIIGEDTDGFELTLLIDTGVDLHSFQPSTADIATISTADIFVYNGGDSDFWVKDVLSQPENENMNAINLMETPGIEIKTEEIVEGMEEHNHDHEEEAHDHEDHDHEEEAHDHEDHDHEEEAHDHEDHDHEDDVHTHDGEVVYDEHIWLSLENAALIVTYLTEQLKQSDSDNADAYDANAEAYITELYELNTLYAETVEGSGRDTLLFADRFPFRYLVDDYDISYYAAFPGCSAETEASFETVIFLSEKLDELALDQVMIIDGASEDLARTIIQNSNNKSGDILTINSMQSVTADDITKGVSYISIMEDNLAVLSTALLG